MRRIETAKMQVYTEIIDINKTWIHTKQVESEGIAMTDGVHDLIIGNVGVLLRVGTVTKNNKSRRIGEAVVSGETAWNIYMTHAMDLLMAYSKWIEMNSTSLAYCRWCSSNE